MLSLSRGGGGVAATARRTSQAAARQQRVAHETCCRRGRRRRCFVTVAVEPSSTSYNNNNNNNNIVTTNGVLPTPREPQRPSLRFFSTSGIRSNSYSNNVHNNNNNDNHSDPWSAATASSPAWSVTSLGYAWEDVTTNESSSSLAFLEPLSYMPPYDTSSRHLIQLLQELYTVGFLRGHERVTVDRCRILLEIFLNEIPPHVPGRVERAHAVLRTMQLFDPPPQQQQQQQQQPLLGPPRVAGLSVWPRPDRACYNLVLRMYAETPSTHRRVPEACRALVYDMHQRFTVGGMIELKTTPFHWNCILMSWILCRDWERSVHATSSTFRYMVVDSSKEFVDASSLVHVMNICKPITPPLDHNDDDKTNSQNAALVAKSAELGANVAARLWQSYMVPANNDNSNDKDTLDSSLLRLDPPPHFYAHFLQAIRGLPPQQHKLRAVLFDQCMTAAKSRGRVSAAVWSEFLIHNHDPAVYRKHVLEDFTKQPQFQQARRKSDKAHVLVQIAPPEWSARINNNSESSAEL